MISSIRLMSLVLLVSLSACNSSGTNVTAQQAAQFVPGKTTTADVTAQLGQPDSVKTLDDGRTIYIYDRMEGSSSPVNFIPVVGLLAGSRHNSQNMVMFTFDSHGIYQSKSSSVSKTNSNSGFLNQGS